MRISDWSSDVCSSAASAMVQAFFRLVAGFSAAGCFAGAFLAGAFRAVVLVAGALPSGFSSDFLSAALKSTTFDPLGRAGSSSGVTLPPLAYLGRASCREWVCRFVVIFGVDV